MDMPLHLSGPALSSKSSHRTTMVCTIKISSLSFDTCEAKKDASRKSCEPITLERNGDRKG